MQLQSGPPLDEISIGCILRDLLHAVEYLHNEGKIHRDIKGSLLLFIHFFFLYRKCKKLKTLNRTTSQKYLTSHCLEVYLFT